MNFCLSNSFNPVQPLVNIQRSLTIQPFYGRTDKVVFVIGATGTGKSRLAIDLATRFRAEIINSDKIQVYKGLDITTNKVTDDERYDIPHHLLGTMNNPDTNFTPIDFCYEASNAIESIIGKERLPIIAGGSNSYIDALVNDCPNFTSRYRCCFLWVDVSRRVLHEFVSRRVDKMVEAGLVDEVREMFRIDGDYSKGIQRAIGVSELDGYFRAEATVDSSTRDELLREGIDKIKENTCLLSCRQRYKIDRLYKQWNWDVYRLDATDVFLKHGEEADHAWEKLVATPSHLIVDRFMSDPSPVVSISSSDRSATGIALSAAPVPHAALAGVSH